VIAALAAATALAWVYIVSMASANDLCAINVSWSARDFALMFAMWSVMMVGMMLPAASPMVLLYAQGARKARRDGSVLPGTAVFVSGYVIAWTLFSAVATLAQCGLDRAALLSPMWEANSTRLAATIAIAAGLYQLTPWKNACLSHCQSPVFYFSRHFRPGARGALGLGFRHGLYCLGCCGVLMGLLFVGGVMNLLWIAGLSAFVLAEKAIRIGPWCARVAGAVLVAGGAFALTR
jgi:predicted metal-binding membrane protein